MLDLEGDFAKSSKPKSKTKRLLIGIVALSVVAGIGNTLAASISLNSGDPIEFGQGMAATVACSGSSNLNITPVTSFTNSTGAGSYKLSGFNVSNIPDECFGKDFVIRAYDDTNSAPLALFDTSSSDIAVYYNSGLFNISATANNGPTGMRVTTEGAGEFSVTFTNPVALSTDIASLTIESVDHDFSRIFLGSVGPGGGIVFYYSPTAFTAQYSTCATDCHYLEFAPENWRSPDSTMYWSADTTNSVGSTTNGYGAGSANTRLMRDAAGAGDTSNNVGLLALSYAASDNSAGQWYVPTNAEMNAAFNFSLENGFVGGFTNSEPWYWTSYEVSDTPSQVVGTAYNSPYINTPFPKEWLGLLRPIRAF
jgi:hypothetical protein